jgi:hypothetical protein
VRDDYIVTVAKDNLVKVWHINPKTLLREIKFQQGVQTAAFVAANLTLAAGH